MTDASRSKARLALAYLALLTQQWTTPAFGEEDFARLAGLARIVHPIRTEPWGQRVFRLLDPDGHIVEVGEPQALWDAVPDR